MDNLPVVKECPKCAYGAPEAFAECPRCGVVVSKYRPIRGDPSSPGGDSEVGGWLSLFLHTPEQVAPVVFGLRALLWAGLAIWGFRLASASIESNAVGDSVLHLINLPFHEAGHLIFSPFGKLIGSLGGTLGQLLVPLICAATLLVRSRDPFGASVCLWWFAENLLDIAPYINDARAGQLPLLGGNTGWAAPYGFHDWIFILNETGLARYDHAIATGSQQLGGALILAALGWAALLLAKQRRCLGWEDV